MNGVHDMGGMQDMGPIDVGRVPRSRPGDDVGRVPRSGSGDDVAHGTDFVRAAITR